MVTSDIKQMKGWESAILQHTCIPVSCLIACIDQNKGPDMYNDVSCLIAYIDQNKGPDMYN